MGSPVPCLTTIPSIEAEDCSNSVRSAIWTISSVKYRRELFQIRRHPICDGCKPQRPRDTARPSAATKPFSELTPSPPSAALPLRKECVDDCGFIVPLERGTAAKRQGVNHTPSFRLKNFLKKTG